ncbi:MAG: S8 family serine peptidase, partial [Candidatus Thermoplasmatota archaeon]
YSTGPDGGYQAKQGTSVANPAVAGAAASIVDWYNSTYGTKPKPSMVKALMINTAYDLANEQDDTGENSPYIPNQDEGWGMVNLPNIVNTDVNLMLQNEDSLLETGEVHDYKIAQDDDTEPLRITLTWTDSASGTDTGPPVPLAEKTLKNDLNLEVESPSGEIYRGNNLVESWSVSGEDTYGTFDTNDDGWDDVNNVENVYLLPEDVEPGTYTVRVIGNDVPSDANNDGYANQDYSLVKWNAVESEPGPLPPTDPLPGDGEIGVTTDVDLSAYVEHEEGENMNVSFYDASDDRLIGEDNIVQSGDRVKVTWEGLETGTKYNWYVVADDGNQTATSDVWSFTSQGENYTIKIDSKEGGNVVEPGEDTYEYEPGMVLEIEAAADDISHFREWIGDNETIENTTANRTNIEILGNYTITALFELKTYNLTIDSTGGGEVLNPGEGEFVFNGSETVNLEAVSDQGYRFVEWTGDVETIEDITASDTPIVIEGNHSITANFEEEKEEGEDEIQVEDLWEIPGLTTVSLIVGTVIAVAIHYKKEDIKENI